MGGSANLKKQQYKANMDIKYLKTIINSELHEHVTNTSNNIDSTGSTYSLNTVVQGDSAATRTGNSILPRYQQINLNINKALSGPSHETFRVILFRYWGEQSSSAPSVTVSEILQTLDPRSFLNDDNCGAKGDRERRIEIHKSKLFTLDQVSDTSRTWKWNVNVNGLQTNTKQHIKFRSAATEEPVSGGFYILFISDNATGANKASFNIYSKLSFYDN